jgi:hypothetical protein
MLTAQDYSTDLDGEPPKKRRRKEVPILKRELDGEAIQRKFYTEVE